MKYFVFAYTDHEALGGPEDLQRICADEDEAQATAYRLLADGRWDTVTIMDEDGEIIGIDRQAEFWLPVRVLPETNGAVQVYVPERKCIFMAHFKDGEFSANWIMPDSLVSKISHWKRPKTPPGADNALPVTFERF